MLERGNRHVNASHRTPPVRVTRRSRRAHRAEHPDPPPTNLRGPTTRIPQRPTSSPRRPGRRRPIDAPRPHRSGGLDRRRLRPTPAGTRPSHGATPLARIREQRHMAESVSISAQNLTMGQYEDTSVVGQRGQRYAPRPRDPHDEGCTYGQRLPGDASDAEPLIVTMVWDARTCSKWICVSLHNARVRRRETLGAAQPPRGSAFSRPSSCRHRVLETELTLNLRPLEVAADASSCESSWCGELVAVISSQAAGPRGAASFRRGCCASHDAGLPLIGGVAK